MGERRCSFVVPELRDHVFLDREPVAGKRSWSQSSCCEGREPLVAEEVAQGDPGRLDVAAVVEGGEGAAQPALGVLLGSEAALRGLAAPAGELVSGPVVIRGPGFAAPANMTPHYEAESGKWKHKETKTHKRYLLQYHRRSGFLRVSASRHARTSFCFCARVGSGSGASGKRRAKCSSTSRSVSMSPSAWAGCDSPGSSDRAGAVSSRASRPPGASPWLPAGGDGTTSGGAGCGPSAAASVP